MNASVENLDDKDQRSGNRLSEQELEKVAQRSAEIVWENFERQVGKTAIRLVIYVLGAMCLVALTWLGLHKEIKIP